MISGVLRLLCLEDRTAAVRMGRCDFGEDAVRAKAMQAKAPWEAS